MEVEEDNQTLHRQSQEDDDDDPPMLSSHALEALKQFLAEQNQTIPEPETEKGPQISLLSEDWRLSQFWYQPETAESIAKEVLHLCSSIDSPRVACIACPTLFVYLKRLDPNLSVQLLEYDKRFEQYGSDFSLYDYKKPVELPSEFKHAYHVVLADPPYLSEECLEKVTQTITFLSQPEDSYLLLLTGEVQKDTAKKLLGLYPCNFRPQHSSKLGNEFRLFTNYDPGSRLDGREFEK
ncbi:Methyltransferase EEF1AKMT1/ZCCHC4 [Dillenia turbinata]|uniref:Protein-lysine N-methyltransferase RJ641_027859 n=1 Tax=Dillenia turbinata TaxID=194707 RepID=A0AAN8ZM26_9MAGN